jgi:valyl-tRNA synthetase
VDAVATVLGGIRGAKSQAKVSMRTELSRVEVTGPGALIDFVRTAEDDLRRAGKVTGDLVLTVDDAANELSVDADVAGA